MAILFNLWPLFYESFPRDMLSRLNYVGVSPEVGKMRSQILHSTKYLIAVIYQDIT